MSIRRVSLTFLCFSLFGMNHAAEFLIVKSKWKYMHLLVKCQWFYFTLYSVYLLSPLVSNLENPSSTCSGVRCFAIRRNSWIDNMAPNSLGIKLISYLFGDAAVPILVHVLKDLFQRSLLSHELSKGQTSVIVSILLIKKVRHFFPECGNWTTRRSILGFVCPTKKGQRAKNKS